MCHQNMCLVYWPISELLLILNTFIGICGSEKMAIQRFHNYQACMMLRSKESAGDGCVLRGILCVRKTRVAFI